MTHTQLWFKGVRSSKFRHVYGVPAKREGSYHNVPITRNAHDSNFCAVNPKFIAIVTEVAGGGAFLVLPIKQTGRVDPNISKVTGHSGPVLDVKWNPFNDNVIASCSDDCTVKLWHIPDSGVNTSTTKWMLDLHGHKRRVGYIEWHPTAENVLASAGFDYSIILWDVGAGEPLTTINCHVDVIHSLSFNRDGSRLATTSKDKKLRIIDPRTGFVISECICHDGSRSSKAVYLSEGRVLTTGFSHHCERQVAVWKEDNLKDPIRKETVDSSSGILFPYFDYDTRVLFLAGKGDGNIRYYEISDDSQCIHFLNQFLSDSPQRGLGFMPKRGCDVRNCEIFRFYKLHTTRNICEPVSMIVPRKSEQFQDDLFPDTAAPVPALTAKEWFSGVNKHPILMSLRSELSLKTQEPKAYRPTESDKMSTFVMKLAFLSNQSVPDYRPLKQEAAAQGEKRQKTSAEQSTKFQQIQQKFTHHLDHSMKEEATKGKTVDKNCVPESCEENQLRRLYERQCDEIRLLMEKIANRDARIKDLEGMVVRLQDQVATLSVREKKRNVR